MRRITKLYYAHMKAEEITPMETTMNTTKQQYLAKLQLDREEIESYIKANTATMPMSVALALQETVLRLHFEARELRKLVLEEVLA